VNRRAGAGIAVFSATAVLYGALILLEMHSQGMTRFVGRPSASGAWPRHATPVFNTAGFSVLMAIVMLYAAVCAAAALHFLRTRKTFLRAGLLVVFSIGFLSLIHPTLIGALLGEAGRRGAASLLRGAGPVHDYYLNYYYAIGWFRRLFLLFGVIHGLVAFAIVSMSPRRHRKSRPEGCRQAT
jgi:hypothetical protein